MLRDHLTPLNLSHMFGLHCPSIPLELIHSNRDSIRKAREAFLISKGKTLEPHGINRRDET